MPASPAQRLHRATHPVHGFVYFSPDLFEAFATLGHTAHRGYFPGRAAALGPVGADVVTATFFNFCPTRVADGMPDSWTRADTDAVQSARMAAAGAVLRRDAGAALDDAGVTEAIGLLERIADGVGYEGKPLAAGNRSVALPDDPWARLWQLVTIPREWRGDAHVAVLTATPVTAVEALVLHAAMGQFPVDVLKSTRAWPEDDWRAATERLTARGLVHPDGSFTDAGRAFRDDIEQRTDDASAPLVAALGDEGVDRLVTLLKPVGAALVAAGAFPLAR